MLGCLPVLVLDLPVVLLQAAVSLPVVQLVPGRLVDLASQLRNNQVEPLYLLAHEGEPGLVPRVSFCLLTAQLFELVQ